MAARLTFEDVRNGRAIPQRGDMVGQYVYTGGDPSDLSLYQPQAQDGYTPPALSGSVFDPKMSRRSRFKLVCRRPPAPDPPFPV